MIIAVEGQNGVGKTTISKSLGKVYNAPVIRSSDDTFLYDLKLTLNRNPEKYALPGLVYYLGALQLASNKAAAINPPPKNVVFDRYSYSVLCTYLAIDSAYYDRRNRDMIKKMVSCAQKGMLRPDITILLNTTDSDRLKRIDKRDQGAKVYRFLFERRFSEEFPKELTQNLRMLRGDGIKTIVIENNTDLNATVSRISSLIDGK